MSMNYRLFPSLNHEIGTCFHSEICFELDSWTSTVGYVIEALPKLPMIYPVRVVWIDKMEQLWPPGTLAKTGMETFCKDSTWMVSASGLKRLELYKDTWHPDRIVRAKSIMAYLGQLPDDWPVLVFYV